MMAGVPFGMGFMCIFIALLYVSKILFPLMLTGPLIRD